MESSCRQKERKPVVDHELTFGVFSSGNRSWELERQVNNERLKGTHTDRKDMPLIVDMSLRIQDVIDSRADNQSSVNP